MHLRKADKVVGEGEAMADLRALQQQVVDRLMAQTVTCHHDKEQAWDIPGVASRCSDCHGSGSRPDSTCTPLLDVLLDNEHPMACSTCRGTTYSIRDWARLPEGALTGALKRVAERAWKAQPVDANEAGFWSEMAFSLTECFYAADPDMAALNMILSALPERQV